jgi:hypothetical protein
MKLFGVDSRFKDSFYANERGFNARASFHLSPDPSPQERGARVSDTGVLLFGESRIQRLISPFIYRGATVTTGKASFREFRGSSPAQPP